MDEPALESDPRFPSGKWVGYFLQRELPGKHWMEMTLTFQDGKLSGEGRDRVGAFTMRGRYQLDDGKCHWHKRYVGKHDVFYQGFNEGKGIWGTWEIPLPPGWGKYTGGFDIWPEGLGLGAEEALHAEADVPAEEELAGVP